MHIGQIGGGKKDQPPCRILYVINSIIFFKYSFNHYPALFPTDLYIREDVICLLDDLEGLLGTLGVSRVLVRVELGEGGLLVAHCKAASRVF